MLRSGDALRRYGDPHKEANMGVWRCPPDLLAENPRLPAKVYCNLDIHRALTAALYKCRDRGVLEEITTFSGCFNIRNIRGAGETSLHAWGLAIDWNAKDNPLGMTAYQARVHGLRPFSDKFVACWEATGWDWGGRFSRADGMHFQLKALP